MDIKILLFNTIDGLGVFMYGMKIMSEALQKFAGGSLKIFDILTSDFEMTTIYVKQFRQNHLERLRQKVCDPDAGLLFNDILNTFFKIRSHFKNFAEAATGQK